MMIETECNVNVRIEVPDDKEHSLSDDDLRTMICNALQHGFCDTGVQLVWQDVCISDNDGDPVICNTYIDVDWDSIERI